MENFKAVGAGFHVDRLHGRAREMVSHVKQLLAPVDGCIRSQAQERLVVVLAAALGLGYLVGHLLRRSGRARPQRVQDFERDPHNQYSYCLRTTGAGTTTMASVNSR